MSSDIPITPEPFVNFEVPLDPKDFDRIGLPTGVAHHKITPGDVSTQAKRSVNSLTALAKDFEIFTTGVILSASLFDRDPLAEYLQQHPPDCREAHPFAIDSNLPLFRGLKTRTLNNVTIDFSRRLYLVHRDYWEPMRDFIAGIRMVGSKPGYYGRIAFYDMRIPDPAIPASPVTITVFAVDSTDTLAYLQMLPSGKIVLMRDDPTEATRIEALRFNA